MRDCGVPTFPLFDLAMMVGTLALCPPYKFLATDSIFKEPIRLRTVIPGRAKREPGIHNHDGEYGFRACAKWRIPE